MALRRSAGPSIRTEVGWYDVDLLGEVGSASGGTSSGAAGNRPRTSKNLSIAAKPSRFTPVLFQISRQPSSTIGSSDGLSDLREWLPRHDKAAVWTTRWHPHQRSCDGLQLLAGRTKKADGGLRRAAEAHGIGFRPARSPVRCDRRAARLGEPRGRDELGVEQ